MIVVAVPDRTMKPGIDDSGTTQGTAMHEDGSTYAWARLAVALVVMTISGASMYVVVVVLPAVQAEFGVVRADASLPYTLTTIGFGIGGLFMGRLADRFGVTVPLLIGGASLGLGFVAAGMAGSDSGALTVRVKGAACGQRLLIASTRPNSSNRGGRRS